MQSTKVPRFSMMPESPFRQLPISGLRGTPFILIRKYIKNHQRKSKIFISLSGFNLMPSVCIEGSDSSPISTILKIAIGNEKGCGTDMSKSELHGPIIVRSFIELMFALAYGNFFLLLR